MDVVVPSRISVIGSQAFLPDHRTVKPFAVGKWRRARKMDLETDRKLPGERARRLQGLEGSGS